IVDRAVAAVAVLASTVPPFVMALAVVAVFAVTWQVLPVSGAWAPGHAPTVASTTTHLVLPALVLGFAGRRVAHALLGRQRLRLFVLGFAIVSGLV
ncbi:hypothetical protein K4H00_21615, partial [Mycobacterium tuberculosis]|nr:hypothetical protein [Mycobacterium tuberculosis]